MCEYIHFHRHRVVSGIQIHFFFAVYVLQCWCKQAEHDVDTGYELCGLSAIKHQRTKKKKKDFLFRSHSTTMATAKKCHIHTVAHNLDSAWEYIHFLGNTGLHKRRLHIHLWRTLSSMSRRHIFDDFSFRMFIFTVAKCWHTQFSFQTHTMRSYHTYSTLLYSTYIVYLYNTLTYHSTPIYPSDNLFNIQHTFSTEVFSSRRCT